MTNQALKPLYHTENALQAINATASRIEHETGIEVIKCHLGNPLGPQCKASNMRLAEYYTQRSDNPNQMGYADVVGDKQHRQIAANALTRINRLPKDSISSENLRNITGGTGALNVVMSVLKDPVVLVSDPYYPPWLDIAEHTKNSLETYKLRPEDDYLLNKDILDKKICEVEAEHPNQNVLLIYHYPHNPTGKTLTEDEAKQVATTLNELTAKHPNLYLVQEDLYLGTTASDMGIYTPLASLSEEAKQHTMWLISGSKLGHARERAALMGAFNTDLLKSERGALSYDSLGASEPALIALAHTLAEIADGGVDAKGAPGSRENNFRYQLADYYQDRLKIVIQGLHNIETKLDTHILDVDSKGTYYLFPDFKFLKGKPIPEALQQVMGGKTTFENADDLALALQNAHLLGLQPVTITTGTLFTENPDTMKFRLATVEQDIEKMNGVVNTFKGLVEKSMNVSLGAEFLDTEHLRKLHPTDPTKNVIPLALVANGKTLPGFGLKY